MTERFDAMTEAELGGAIAAVSVLVEWPAEPDVAGDVLATVRAFEARPSMVAPRLSMPSRRRTLLLIAAAVLALAGAALAARLVIDLGAVAIEVLPGRPTALPTNVVTPDDLGREVTLAEAAASAGFPPALPSELPPPDGTWVEEAQVGFAPDDLAPRISSWWVPSDELPTIRGTKHGAALMQFPGDWEVAAKLVFAETNRFGEAIVDGRPAFWTTGEHELDLLTSDGPTRFLVTGNVLIWQDAGLTFRLETALGKAQAVAIAESVDPDAGVG